MRSIFLFIRTSLTCLIFIMTIATPSFADHGKHKGWHKHHKNHGETRVIERRVEVYNREPIRQPVLAHPCPFSCSTQGVPRQYCRDWRNRNLCFVQVLRTSVIPYRVISLPSPQRSYYMVDPTIIDVPNVTLGEIIGDKVRETIDRNIR